MLRESRRENRGLTFISANLSVSHRNALWPAENAVEHFVLEMFDFNSELAHMRLTLHIPIPAPPAPDLPSAIAPSHQR
jgi:hypothetical protein